MPASIKYNNRWKHISKDYNIDNTHRLKREIPSYYENHYTKNEIESICKLMEMGYRNSEIKHMLSKEYPAGLFKAIRNKKAWNQVSDKYHIPTWNDFVNPITQYTKEIEKMIINNNDYGNILSSINMPDNRTNRKFIAGVKQRLKQRKLISSTTIDQL